MPGSEGVHTLVKTWALVRSVQVEVGLQLSQSFG